MGQRATAAFVASFAGLVLAMLAGGCDRSDGTSATSVPGSTSRSNGGRVTVASLVPAATDLIIGMGAADQLVAVSNYDVPRDAIAGLPRVGDYQTVDWEQIHGLRPRVLIIFHRPDRIPASMRQQAERLDMRLVNVRTETLEDLYEAIAHLGEVLGQPEKAAQAQRELRQRIESVRRAVAGRPRPRTLIVRDAQAEGAVGRETFLNDLLEVAGGENVVTQSGWPTFDREALVGLQPDVILQLLSGDAQQVVEQAQRVWPSLQQIPAVREGRVHIINEWYSQQPGFHVAELAEKFARALHPDAMAPMTEARAAINRDRP